VHSDLRRLEEETRVGFFFWVGRRWRPFSKLGRVIFFLGGKKSGTGKISEGIGRRGEERVLQSCGRYGGTTIWGELCRVFTGRDRCWHRLSLCSPTCRCTFFPFLPATSAAAAAAATDGPCTCTGIRAHSSSSSSYAAAAYAASAQSAAAAAAGFGGLGGWGEPECGQQHQQWFDPAEVWGYRGGRTLPVALLILAVAPEHVGSITCAAAAASTAAAAAAAAAYEAAPGQQAANQARCGGRGRDTQAGAGLFDGHDGHTGECPEPSRSLHLAVAGASGLRCFDRFSPLPLTPRQQLVGKL
jgi:hypothetical protein